MPTTEDPSIWISRLLSERWTVAADALVAAGVDVPTREPPIALAPASSVRSGGNIKHQTRVKVYEASDETSSPGSWGDTDRDASAVWAIDVQCGGPRARESAWSARLIVDRILSEFRDNPHRDWHRISGWRVATPQDFNDYQHVVFTLRLNRYGEILPLAIPRVGA